MKDVRVALGLGMMTVAFLIGFQNCSTNLGNSNSENQSAAVNSFQMSPAIVSVNTAGSAQLVAVGGQPPYSFVSTNCAYGTLTSNGLFQAGSSAGACTVTVSDSTGKTASGVVSIALSLLSPTGTYNWLASGWSSCSAACGSGTQTQTYVCQDSNGNTVANSNCSGTPPPTSQACNTQACGCQLVGSGFCMSAFTGATSSPNGSLNTQDCLNWCVSNQYTACASWAGVSGGWGCEGSNGTCQAPLSAMQTSFFQSYSCQVP